MFFFFFSSRRRHTRCSRDWSSDVCFFVSSRRRHTRCSRDWSSDVCSSDLIRLALWGGVGLGFARFSFDPSLPQSARRMTQPAVLVEDKSTGFLRELGLLDSTMIVAGSMIGSGIFIVSADIARQVGSAGGLILTWAITGLLTITAGLSSGELAAMMPAAGRQE